MAHPSTTTWSKTTITTTATRKQDSAPSNSAYLLFFSTIHNPQHVHRKKSRLFTFSLDHSSASSSSSTSHSTTLTRVTNRKRSLQKNGRNYDGSFSVLYPEDLSSAVVKEEQGQERTDCGGSVVQNYKKRPFWRKFLFKSKKLRSILLLNAITIVYASNNSVVKAVETMMDPAAFSAVRFVMSAIPFLPFVFRAHDEIQTRNAGIELGLWVSLGYLFEALGLLTSEAGRASFISLFTVIMVPLLDGMLGAMVPARTWFGVLMSAVGMAMLECSGSPPNIGDLLNFLSALFFGIHMLRTEHYSRSTRNENFMALLGYEVCVVAAFSTIWVMIGGWFDDVQELDQSIWTWALLWNWIVEFPWIAALYTGLFSTGLCLWVEIAAMRDVSATETAIIYGLEPLWGAGFAWFLLGERWGTAGWIGAALVLAGSLTVQIFGSSSGSKSVKDGEKKGIGGVLMVSDKRKLQSGLSASPVVVRSRKDVTDMLK